MPLKRASSCKYLDIHLDTKLSINFRIDFDRAKLRKQCGILRKYVIMFIRLFYSNTIALTLNQFAIRFSSFLVYGCTI